MDEIPIAFREADKTIKSKTNKIDKGRIILIVAGLGFLAVVGFLLFGDRTSKQTQSLPNSNSNQSSPSTVNNQNKNGDDNNIPENILGHLPYEQAPENELKAINRDGSIKLRAKAAEKFLAMQRDARQQGVIITPISGFRSVKDQEYLFFKVKEQRQQVTSKRAEVSAPPGYSEHHTGYAVDIGDGNVPSANLHTSFENTAAYKWLSQNASRYSFEVSFTPDNLQGISYEPWHWRYVGDTHSLETFYKARQLKTKIYN